MSGTQLFGNCYDWSSVHLVCNLSKSNNDVKLLHKRLGHISLPSIRKALSADVALESPI